MRPLRHAPTRNRFDVRAWARPPDNTSAVLSNDLSNVDISIGENVVHTIGVKNAGGPSGPLMVRRLRKGQAVQSVELIPNESAGLQGLLHVVTSAEGAAIASNDAWGWIAPSQSFTFTLNTALGRCRGGVRRGHTVLFPGVLPDGVTGVNTGAVFAYDEVSGQPRLTRLTPDTSNFNATLVDIVGTQGSEYFAFAPNCAFGRIRLDASGVPILESASCAFSTFNRIDVVAVTPTGETVVQDAPVAVFGTRLSVLSETGVRKIAGGALVTPVLDRTTNPPTLVAWVVHDNPQGLACVEESPIRCWRVPGDMTLLDSRIESGSPGIVSLLMYRPTVEHHQFAVVRTVGPGDATPP